MSFRLDVIDHLPLGGPVDDIPPPPPPPQSSKRKSARSVAPEPQGWNDLLKALEEAYRNPGLSPGEQSRQALLRERAQEKHASLTQRINTLKKRFDVGVGTPADKLRLDQYRDIRGRYEALKHTWKNPLSSSEPSASKGPKGPRNSATRTSSLARPRPNRLQLQRIWNQTFDRKKVAQAFHTGVGQVPTNAGGLWNTYDAVRRFQEAFGTSIGGDRYIADNGALYADAYDYAGGSDTGDDYGRMSGGHFNRGQADTQVDRGLNRKKRERDFYYNPDGTKKTDSQRIRDSVNRMKGDLTGYLNRQGLPDWASGMVADSLLSPMDIGAELQTIGDGNESFENKARATFNASVGLLTTAAGGKLIAPVFAPVLRPVAAAAMRLGQKAAPAVKEFGRALWRDSARAVQIAHVKLGIPLEEAQRMVEGFSDKVRNAQRSNRQTPKTHLKSGNKPGTSPIQGQPPHTTLSDPPAVSRNSVRQRSSPDITGDANAHDFVPLGVNRSYGRGKTNILETIERERAKGAGNAFEDNLVYRMTLRFLHRLPDHLVKDIELYIDDLIEQGAFTGEYVVNQQAVGVARRLKGRSNAPAVARTLVHEVAHHLQRYLTEEDMRLLWGQFVREMTNDVKRTGRYRYKSFNEWWAHTLEDHINDTQFRLLEIEDIKNPLKRAIKKGVYAVEQVQRALVAMRLRDGGRNHATRVYNEIRKGNRSDLGLSGAGGRELLKMPLTKYERSIMYDWTLPYSQRKSLLEINRR